MISEHPYDLYAIIVHRVSSHSNIGHISIVRTLLRIYAYRYPVANVGVF